MYIATPAIQWTAIEHTKNCKSHTHYLHACYSCVYFVSVRMERWEREGEVGTREMKRLSGYLIVGDCELSANAIVMMSCNNCSSKDIIDHRKFQAVQMNTLRCSILDKWKYKEKQYNKMSCSCVCLFMLFLDEYSSGFQQYITGIALRDNASL